MTFILVLENLWVVILKGCCMNSIDGETMVMNYADMHFVCCPCQFAVCAVDRLCSWQVVQLTGCAIDRWCSWQVVQLTGYAVWQVVQLTDCAVCMLHTYYAAALVFQCLNLALLHFQTAIASVQVLCTQASSCVGHKRVHYSHALILPVRHVRWLFDRRLVPCIWGW